MIEVIKRDGSKQPYDEEKIKAALHNAFKSCGYQEAPEAVIIYALFLAEHCNPLTVEDIQNKVEEAIMYKGYYDVARAFITYREKHKELRLIKDRVDWIDQYMNSKDNAATSSETDANANVSIKNVANIDGEVYKTLNRQIQRYRMRKKLEQLFPEVARRYEEDLEHHIIYTHDEASSPAVKNYCEAVSLYPLLQEGTKGMDGLGTTAPHNLSSFCGQLVNLTFLLSTQCKGAVAFGEFFNFLDYFCVKDFGADYHTTADTEIASHKPFRTVKDSIHQAYQQIVYGWNQPAGNRSYQSP